MSHKGSDFLGVIWYAWEINLLDGINDNSLIICAFRLNHAGSGFLLSDMPEAILLLKKKRLWVSPHLCLFKEVLFAVPS